MSFKRPRLSDHDLDDEYLASGLGSRPTVLPVRKVPTGDQSLPPLDGEEYLRRVRLEAAGIPDVMINSCTSVHLESNSFAVAEQPSSVPQVDKECLNGVLEQFRDLQTKFMQQRKASQPTIFVGSIESPHIATADQIARKSSYDAVNDLVSKFPASLNDRHAWYKHLYNEAPHGCANLWKPNVLVVFSQYALLKILSMHRAWLRSLDSVKVQIMQLKTIYCVLTALDPLLESEHVCMLREIGQECTQIWACAQSRRITAFEGELILAAEDNTLQVESNKTKSNHVQKEASMDEELLNSTILLLAIISRAFGQHDLCTVNE